MHFLAASSKGDESALLISFDESEPQLRTDALALGINLDHAAILDLTPQATVFREMQTYDLFSPAEVERDPITTLMCEQIESVRPRRIFIDGFGQFCHLANGPFHLRRLIQSCFRFIVEHDATLLVSCDGVDRKRDLEIQAAADGVVLLQTSATARQLQVTKFRGSNFQAGWHVMQLTDTGIIVSPTAA
jgi:circadian clock protein KaiC